MLNKNCCLEYQSPAHIWSTGGRKNCWKLQLQKESFNDLEFLSILDSTELYLRQKQQLSEANQAGDFFSLQMNEMI